MDNSAHKKFGINSTDVQKAIASNNINVDKTADPGLRGVIIQLLNIIDYRAQENKALQADEIIIERKTGRNEYKKFLLVLFGLIKKEMSTLKIKIKSNANNLFLSGCELAYDKIFLDAKKIRIHAISPEWLGMEKTEIFHDSSFVTEYNPNTGQVRTWMESYDHIGNVNRVHPKMIDGRNIVAQHYPPTKIEIEIFMKKTRRPQIMYTKAMFGVELKNHVSKRQPTEQIGEWAYSMYLEHIEDIDQDFRRMILTLTTMELGSQFAFTYEELNQIADDLIAGKDVHL